MASAVTLSTMIARVRQAADLEGSDGPVTDAEIGGQLGLAVRRLYERLILARGQEYYRTTAELNVAPGQALYSLPGDFFQLLAVVACDSAVMAVPSATFSASDSGNSGRWVRLVPFSLAELEQLLGADRREGWAGRDRPRYRLRGSQGYTSPSPGAAVSEVLELRPAPTTTWTLRIEYLPAALVETAGGWTINGVNGWEEVCILEVAAYCLAKQEQDTRYLKQRVAEEYARIDSLARARDAGASEGIVDTCGLVGGCGWGRGRLPVGWGWS